MIDPSYLEALQEKIGIKFKKKELLKEALTHRSYLNENRSRKISSNERLEFLGDSILSLIVAQELYQKNKNATEGELTALRSILVRSQTLAGCAKDINLGEYLLLSRGERKNGKTNPTLLADAYEALIGAIYLDQGLEVVTRFVKKYLLDKEDLLAGLLEDADVKGKLQMVIQEKFKKTPIYKLLKERGPDHLKTFKVGVFLGRTLLGEGVGESLKKASQNAAASALKQLEGEE